MPTKRALQHDVEFCDQDVPLGVGSRGPVILGRYQGKEVALKLLGHNAVGEEADAQPQAHPNLVKTLVQMDTARGPVEVRELCEDGEFFDMIAEHGKLSAVHSARIFSQLCAVVAHCHGDGFANGQLRAEHVLMRDETPKLLGFRHRVKEGRSERIWLRPLQELDAPEFQGRAELLASPRELMAADVWSLGVLLAGMLLGRAPFRSAQQISSPFVSFLNTGLSAFENLREATPRPLHSMLSAALQTDPQQRPSAQTMLDELQSLRNSIRDVPAPSPLASATDAEMPDWGLPSSSEMARGSCGASTACSTASPAISAASGDASTASSPLSTPQTPSRRLDVGYVSCLGWEWLPRSADALREAVVSTLTALQISFSASDGFHFTIRPAPSAGHQPESTPLLVTVQIFIANDVGSSHHIDVRRQSGGQWRFMEFYTQFRKLMGEKLEMAGQAALSMYSPHIKKRSDTSGKAALGFTRRSTGMEPPPAAGEVGLRGMPSSAAPSSSASTSASCSSFSRRSASLAQPLLSQEAARKSKQ